MVVCPLLLRSQQLDLWESRRAFPSSLRHYHAFNWCTQPQTRKEDVLLRIRQKYTQTLSIYQRRILDPHLRKNHEIEILNWNRLLRNHLRKAKGSGCCKYRLSYRNQQGTHQRRYFSKNMQEHQQIRAEEGVSQWGLDQNTMGLWPTSKLVTALHSDQGHHWPHLGNRICCHAKKQSPRRLRLALLHDHYHPTHTWPQGKDYQIKREMDKLPESYSHPKERFEERTTGIEI